MAGVTTITARSGRTWFVIFVLVIAPLGLSIVEMPGASLRIFWRFAVLSFDHPSTQLLDEVACESRTADANGSVARDFSRWIPSHRFVPPADPDRFVSWILFSGVNRSPPTV